MFIKLCTRANTHFGYGDLGRSEEKQKKTESEFEKEEFEKEERSASCKPSDQIERHGLSRHVQLTLHVGGW